MSCCGQKRAEIKGSAGPTTSRPDPTRRASPARTTPRTEGGRVTPVADRDIVAMVAYLTRNGLRQTR